MWIPLHLCRETSEELLCRLRVWWLYRLQGVWRTLIIVSTPRIHSEPQRGTVFTSPWALIRLSAVIPGVSSLWVSELSSNDTFVMLLDLKSLLFPSDQKWTVASVAGDWIFTVSIMEQSEEESFSAHVMVWLSSLSLLVLLFTVNYILYCRILWNRFIFS